MDLAHLLTAGAAYAPEYDGGLSNHLPMTLLALHSLGAEPARLADWAAGYVSRLEAAPAARPWPAQVAWPARLGELEAWPAHRAYFAGQLAAHGIDAVLAAALPVLMPGCGAAAFHGPIRVASAVRAGHAGELAAALAYWAVRHLPLGPLRPPARTTGRLQSDPEVLLRRLRAGHSNKGLILERMQDAAAEPRLHAEVARLAVAGDTLQRLARLSAKAYAGTGNFTALHLVTGCHAMRVLLPFVSDKPAALRWFWQAWATAVVAAALQRRKPAALRPWSELVAAALLSRNEHVVKLVDACREEERAYGGDDWRVAASRAIA
jgi:hypothetical protein